ncbi:hypothetical protein HaLaN_00098 [Haematococcus lacustris]|uniref:Uncharacterized protein n=1 Tax=Haematococcus lacustris TaxID=44745 RepID=A0A699YCN1_HAELA|nr:hypothetical protein HaLaN_00098 [Haematococcus lacustris]
MSKGGPAIPQPGHRSTTAPSHGGSSGAVSGGGDSGSSGKLSVSLIATLAAGGSALLMVMALVLSLKAGVLNVVRWPARCCHGGSTKHDGGAGEDASDTELGLIKGRGSGGGATPAGGPGPGGAPGTSLADNSWHSGKPRPDTIPEDMDSTSLTITVQPPPCGSPTPPSTTSLSPSPLKPPPLLTSNAVFEASRQGLSQGGSSCTCGSSGCSLGASHSGEGVDKRLPAAYPLGASRYIPGLEPYPLPVPPVVPGMPVVPVVPLTATAVLPQQRPAANDFSRVTPIPGARPLAFTASNAAVMDWSGRVAQQQRDILDGGSNYIDEVDDCQLILWTQPGMSPGAATWAS